MANRRLEVVAGSMKQECFFRLNIIDSVIEDVLSSLLFDYRLIYFRQTAKENGRWRLAE